MDPHSKSSLNLNAHSYFIMDDSPQLVNIEGGKYS